jgi:DNA ligase-1
MARREFLQLAKKFEMGKHDPSGMYVSEKLDGTRVFWDGGVTRGLPTTSVPWANIMDPKKPGELKKKIKPVATGLWSRYGNPIIAPDWWLNQLPQMFLDGELFAGRGNFQTLRSITAKDVAEEERWREVEFAVFGTPSISQVFAEGEIKNPNFHLEVRPNQVKAFLDLRASVGVMDEFIYSPGQTFAHELALLHGALPTEGVVYLHHHTLLPDDRAVAESTLERVMDQTMDVGGEGVMLRNPDSLWLPKRVNSLLKMKPFLDDEGVVVGFVSGRKTDKGSKLLGLIGALVLDYKGKRLELSGFTDEERKFDSDFAENCAVLAPGEDMPAGIEGKHFKIGDTVEFRYRELSDDGVPKEARYYRGV